MSGTKEIQRLEERLARLRASNAALAGALRNFLAIWPNIWDRVDGAAVVMPERVHHMEAAFDSARNTLAKHGAP